MTSLATACSPRSRTLLAAAACLLGTASAAAPAAAQVGHSLNFSGPATATVAQPSVLQATGTVSDDPSVFLQRYINAYALPAGVVASCPATYQNAIQIKDSTIGQGAQSVALAIPVDGSFSVPIAFTSSVPGRFLICGYLNDGHETDATASHAIDVAAPPSGGGPADTSAPAARPTSVRKPMLKRAGRKLVCTRGQWTGDGLSYAYHWTVDGKRKPGATARKLRISRKLRGHKVRCGVTAGNAAGSATALSRARTV